MKLSYPHRQARSRGFTLIELLVVISIIALLVTGAFGAYGFVMEKAKKAEAQSACVTVVNAIDQYFNDYDYLPSPTSATKGTDCESDTSNAEQLILILKGMEITQNPRSQDYLGDIKDAKRSGDGKATGGLVRDAETVELVDPWGRVYEVIIDLDLNKKVRNPNDEEATSGVPELYKSAVTWSAGKDGDPMIWKDNVGSW